MTQPTDSQTDATTKENERVQQLIADNERLKKINDRLQHKLKTLRDGISELTKRIKKETPNGTNE